MPSCYSYLPTELQYYFLEAIFGREEKALLSWQHCEVNWKRLGALRELEPLFPLLAKRAKKFAPESELTKHCNKSFYGAWLRFEKQKEILLILLRNWQNAGIPALLLKGTLINHLYGGRFAPRLMSDFDVLIPKSQLFSSVKLLEAQGWKCCYESFANSQNIPLSKYAGYRHAVSFRHPTTPFVLDLHWHALRSCSASSWDEIFWEDAAPIRIGNEKAYALSPTLHLLHTLVHGVEWTSPRQVKWICDALLILSFDSQRIDWAHFVSLASRMQIVPLVGSALSYLKEKFCIEVLAEPIALLRNTKHSKTDLWEFKMKTTPWNAQFFGNLPFVLFHHRRTVIPAAGVSKYLTIFAHTREVAKYSWGLESLWHSPFLLLKKFSYLGESSN